MELFQLLATIARSIGELELSVRPMNCLERANIFTIGDLIIKSEEELLGFRFFGKKCMANIKEALLANGLKLDMSREIAELLIGKKLRKRNPDGKNELD